jgi:hypothetical protein
LHVGGGKHIFLGGGVHRRLLVRKRLVTGCVDGATVATVATQHTFASAAAQNSLAEIIVTVQWRSCARTSARAIVRPVDLVAKNAVRSTVRIVKRARRVAAASGQTLTAAVIARSVSSVTRNVRADAARNPNGEHDRHLNRATLSDFSTEQRCH